MNSYENAATFYEFTFNAKSAHVGKSNHNASANFAKPKHDEYAPQTGFLLRL